MNCPSIGASKKEWDTYKKWQWEQMLKEDH